MNTVLTKRCVISGTKIILWNGEIKNVEDIKIGNTLIGNDGEKRTVLKLFNGTDQMYKISQDSGVDYIVNSEHILSFKFNNSKKIYWKQSLNSWYVEWFDKITMKIKSKKLKPTENCTKEEAYIQMKEFVDNLDNNNTINIPVQDYLRLSDKTKKLLYGYKIEKPVNWEYKNVKIDPYILGMWLGDEYKSELVDYWKKWDDMDINKSHDVCKNITIFKKNLEEYGLLSDKFIPKDYIFNSKEVRLSLLAGLIDTDGSTDQDGVKITICLEHKSVLEDAKFIADSLGFQTSIKNKKTTCTYDGIKKNGDVLVLTISGYGIENIPTLLPRKKCRSPLNLENNWTTIIVEPYDIGEFYGFEIDGNNLFVLPDFTVLHNCEQAGRTVIGPDPTLRTGQLAVPPEMASNLTVPVQVTNYNLDYITKIVNDGKANYVIKKDNGIRINLEHKLFFRGTILEHGDIIIRTDKDTGKTTEFIINNGKEMLQPGDRLKRNGEFITDIKYPEKRMYHLNIGDIVERQLMDKDIVLLNRQPTLHEGSMMAQEIVIRKGKTLRFNLAIAKAFNADFDGDEMNIHVPQTVEAQTELKLLSASKYKIISAQGSKPNFCIVQDSLLGAYRMTLGNQPLKKHQFYDISLKLGFSIDKILKKIQHIRRILKEKGKKIQCFNGKGLFSLVLPDDLHYENKNDGDPNEPILKIFKGVLYEGTLNKTVLGSTANSLIQIINKEYGPDEACQFIDGVQFITNNWLLISGFSVGIEDCLVQGQEQVDKIDDVIKRCYIEAEGIKTTTTHPGIREVRITGALSKAKDIGLKIAKDALSDSNNFLSTVKSGSKGDWFNIAQVTGLLGQQNLLGKRVTPVLNNGNRTLPHYPMKIEDINMEYESRGFIENSFIQGLNPKQFYYHSMSGREGCADKVVSAIGSCIIGFLSYLL